MTDQTFGAPGMPDPEANREAWLAAHPGAAPVTPDAAAAAAAAQLGGAAPAPGMSDAEMAARIAAGGAAPGTLPQESVYEQLMAQIKEMGERLGSMERERALERQAHIAALGEPILERYAKGVADKFGSLLAAHPGLGRDHFARPLRDAAALYEQAKNTIQSGANDLAPVRQLAASVERWITRTHPRTVPGGNTHRPDFSSILYDIEMILEEADRLAPAALALA